MLVSKSFFLHFKSEDVVFGIQFLKQKSGFNTSKLKKYIYFYNYKRSKKRLNHGAPIRYRNLMDVFLVVFLLFIVLTGR